MTLPKHFLISIVLIVTALFSTGCTYMGFTDVDSEEAKRQYADADSSFVEIQGVQLHYRDEGDDTKPALVLLHGIMASLHTWDGWVDALKNDFRIIRVDIPGFGLTGPYPDNVYNIERSVEMVDELTRFLGVDNFYLAGNSMGGYISWNYAVAHPEKVDRLILLDSAGYPFDPPMMLELLQTPVLKQGMGFLTPRFIVTHTLNEVYGDATLVKDETIDRYHTLMLREGNRQAVVEVFASMKQMDSAKISQVSVPTLIMWGDTDRWIPLNLSARFNADIEGSELIVYPGVGHIPMEELPQKTAADAKAFLTSVIDQSKVIAPVPVVKAL